MYCNKCGQSVPDGSQFCNYCGSRVATAVADQVAVASVPVRAVDQEEHQIFTLRPTIIFVVIRFIVATIAVIAAAAVMGIWSSRSPETVTSGVAFAVIGAVAVLAYSFPVYRAILRLREVYTMTNHKLEMRYGLIAKTVRNIPLSKIQDVTVTSSVWQRFLNLGDIEIDSASEGGTIILNDIHYPDRYANMILG
jgi:uncharacterized membrane protein YdbT with pleckstrin-like domain